jgi:hypothetical protein
MMSLLGIPARLRDAYPTPLRAAMSLLWLAGALLALVTTLLALAHEAGPAVAAYPLVAAVLIALAIATWLRAWWALGVSFAVSGLQVFGVIGSLVELVAGIDPDKVASLRAIGVDPTLAVMINLAFAAVSCCLFVLAVTQLRRSAPSRTDAPS